MKNETYDDFELNVKYWQYRVTSTDGVFQIREVYFDDDGTPQLMSEHPDYPQGDTVEELKEDIQAMLKALELPVLDYDEFMGG